MLFNHLKSVRVIVNNCEFGAGEGGGGFPALAHCYSVLLVTQRPRVLAALHPLGYSWKYPCTRHLRASAK